MLFLLLLIGDISVPFLPWYVYRHVHGLGHQLITGERGAQGEGAAKVGRRWKWRKLRAGVGQGEETHTCAKRCGLLSEVRLCLNKHRVRGFRVGMIN